MRGLRIYEIDPRYIKYLTGFQEHVFSSDGEKSGRKYIGVIFEIHEFKYFAPLSSFKEKHERMKERVDLIKIKDYCVININNMIPVPDRVYKLVDVNGIRDIHYKALLQEEIREISRQHRRIIKNADIIYKHKLRNGNNTPLSKRSNDFTQLEKACKDYSS